jgi:hypothetical protein
MREDRRAMRSNRLHRLLVPAGKSSLLFDGQGLMFPARQLPEERWAQHSAHACEAVWRDGAKGIDPGL